MSEEVVDNAPAVEATTEAPVTESVETSTETPSNFYDGWADDLKADPSLSKFKDEQEVFRSYRELQKLVGYKGDIPAPDAEDGQWSEFWGKMGRPEDKSGYEFNIPEELSGVEGYDTYLDKVGEAALKHNIPKKQAEGLIADMMEYEKTLHVNGQQASTDSQEQAVQMLDSEWGDSKDAMISGIRALMGAKGLSPEVAEAIESDPQTMLLLGSIAKDLDEKGQAGDAYMSTKAGLDDQLGEVNSQIQEIMMETNNIKDPRLDTLLSKRERLMEKSLD